METIITGLVNAGGLGLLAAALFWLHSRTLERFDHIQARTLERFDAIIARTMDVYRQEIATERLASQAQHAELVAGEKELRHAVKDVSYQVALQGAVIRAALKLPEMQPPPEKTL